ncbi:hypothetical protein [Streptomyces sp. SID4985]|uniref:hypothetical protein n=1 Tax=unclassified Streptomyces TaxID=2593676 RepID=UPI001370F266|nr:hypothetical protein [Streptomyces sp. SID4985]MYQ45791.1 hypothetical protein [Streptomyces sp. SID4985]
MARMSVDGDELVVRLSLRERAAARHGDVRVPLAAVRRVTAEPGWWRALRGVPLRGTARIGTRAHQAGTDFTVVRPGKPVVCVELRPPAPYRLLAVSVPTLTDARSTAGSLGRSAPGLDTSTRYRQPLPVPGEGPPRAALT